MCTVSMVVDGYREQFPDRWPYLIKRPAEQEWNPSNLDLGYASKAALEALRQEVLELKQLILAAQRFDEHTGQPDCQTEEKLDLLRALADQLGVDLSDVLPAPDASPLTNGTASVSVTDNFTGKPVDVKYFFGKTMSGPLL